MGKPKLVLHIGTEKTGTTHTQMFLKRNRERLAELGIALGPDARADSSTYRAALNTWPYRQSRFMILSQEELDAFQVEYWTMIENLANSGANTVFLSHETLSKLKPEKLAPFFEKISSYFESVTVVGFFRRPDYYAASFYSLTVGRGTTRLPDEEYVKAHSVSFDEQVMIRNWTETITPDTFIAFPYLDSFKQDSFQLLRRFLALLGVPESEQDPEKWNHPEKKMNVRSSALATEYIRQLNPLAPSVTEKGKWNGKQRRILIKRVSQKFPGEPVRVPEATIKFILDTYPPSAVQEIAVASTSPEWNTPEFRQEWDEWLQAPEAKSADIPVVSPEQIEVVKQELFGRGKPLNVGGDDRSKVRKSLSKGKANLRKKLSGNK